MTTQDRLKLKQALLDSLESARRKLMDEINQVDGKLTAGTDLAVVEQDVNSATSTFINECLVAVDTFVTTTAMKHFSG